MQRPSRQIPPEVIREFADRGVKWLLERPENLQGLLPVIAEDLAPCFDFSRVEALPPALIPRSLRKREADVIVRLPFRPPGEEKEREVIVFLLVEHQSMPDSLMPLRLLEGMVGLWRKQERNWKKRTLAQERRLYPIIAIVFYTGSQHWSMPLELKSLMDLPEQLERFLPKFESLVLNLKATPEEELTKGTRGQHPFGWLLRVMQKEDASKEELMEALQIAIEHLASMEESEPGLWSEVIEYFMLIAYHRRETEEGREMSEKIVRQAREKQKAGAPPKVWSLADQLMYEGGRRVSMKAGRWASMKVGMKAVTRA